MKSVIICDMEGLITNMNEGAEKVFGYPSDELVGIKRVSIFSPGEIVLQNVLGWLKDANESGEHNTKTNFIRKDGSKFSAKIKITPNFGDGKNNPQTGYCGITEVIDEDVNIKINWGTKIIKGVAFTFSIKFTAWHLLTISQGSVKYLDLIFHYYLNYYLNGDT
jgi:PAS domain S-box-containing protein